MRSTLQSAVGGMIAVRPGHPNGLLLRALALSVALAASSGCGDAPTSGGPQVAATQWEPASFAIDRAITASNPFDPREVSLDADFLSPSGASATVPGFATKDYERAIVDGREVLTPTSGLRWEVRFTPTEAGRWRWRWRETTPSGQSTGEWQALHVAPARPGSQGFVRVSDRDPRQLRFDDDSSFVAIGENMAWYDGRGTAAYDEWLGALAEAGGTYIRLWMPSWAFGIEWIERDASGAVTESTLGNYAERLDRAWQLDYVIDLARRHGIQVMLSIQNHGAFSLSSNSEWSDSPYNATNGGPLAQPRDLFTDATARELFRRRLRYVVGRWGAAPNLLAWELWNEVDLVEQPALDALLDWHREMAGVIRAHDPHRHLITTSLGGVEALVEIQGTDSALSPLWDLPEIDLVQAHLYAIGSLLPLDFPEVVPALLSRLGRFGKPVLLAEAGVDFRGPVETITADPEGDGFHDLLWSGLLAGGFGTGMTWWWDNVIHPENLYSHFSPIAVLLEGVDFDAERFVPGLATASAPPAAERPLRALTLAGERTVLAWVEDVEHRWFDPDPVRIDGASLAIEGVPDGRYDATWIDTRTGATETGGEVEATRGRIALTAPPFAKDLALRLERLPR